MSFTTRCPLCHQLMNAALVCCWECWRATDRVRPGEYVRVIHGVSVPIQIARDTFAVLDAARQLRLTILSRY